MNGFIKLYRQILKWEWYTNVNTRVVFFHLLLTVNWKDATWKGIEIKRGQRLTSIAKLSEEVGLKSEKKVRVALEHLKATGEIAVETSKSYTLITVNNYEQYQSKDADEYGDEEEAETPVFPTLPENGEKKGKQKGKQEAQKRANKRANSEQPQTPAISTVTADGKNKKGKQKGKELNAKRANKRATNEEEIYKKNIYIKNNIKYIVEKGAKGGGKDKLKQARNATSAEVKAIIDYLNEKLGTKYRATTASTQRHINARFKEGHRIEDFERVIDTKCAEWKDNDKMSKYLRPETLFGTKFESYLNQGLQGGKENASNRGSNAGYNQQNGPGATRKLGTYI